MEYYILGISTRHCCKRVIQEYSAFSTISGQFMVEKKLEYGDIVVAHACTFSLGKCGLSGSKPFVFRSLSLRALLLHTFVVKPFLFL